MGGDVYCMKKEQKGFISTIILVIIGLALLKYFFDWSIFDALASEEGKGTISYIRQLLDTIWSYIKAPITFAWNKILWPVLEFTWQAFLALMEEGKEAAANL